MKEVSVIGGTERLLESRRAVPANRQKAIGEAEALFLTTRANRSRSAIVTAVVMLSPVNLDNSSAIWCASRFLIFNIFYLSTANYQPLYHQTDKNETILHSLRS
jgi:hypothetical protein